MISFRDREDVGPGIVSILSLIAILGAFLFLTFVKPPQAADINRADTNKRVTYKKQAQAAQLELAKSQKPIDQLTWTGGPQFVQSAALQLVTNLAQKHALKMTVFRTQRATLVDNLVSLPYVVTVEGTFPGMLAFARDLEDTKNKLAVTQIQISSSDPNSDSVTANVGIVAYVNPKEAVPVDSNSPGLQTRRSGSTLSGLFAVASTTSGRRFGGALPGAFLDA